MTTRDEREIEPTAADGKHAAESPTTNDVEATEGAQELAGEELEARIAPATFSEFHFTRPTSSSSP